MQGKNMTLPPVPLTTTLPSAAFSTLLPHTAPSPLQQFPLSCLTQGSLLHFAFACLTHHPPLYSILHSLFARLPHTTVVTYTYTQALPNSGAFLHKRQHALSHMRHKTVRGEHHQTHSSNDVREGSNLSPPSNHI
mmetsp:Transcript_25202/g.68499  ORF Transcript_25202/g.68499 Transcript_25202/m.68499 type:complete len:135 (+) Transcript_25202:631-1035(+)